MDEQHKKLIELINTMYGVMRKKHEASAVSAVLTEMEEYAEVHFKDEEKMLHEQGYAQVEEHSALHRNYQERMKELLAQYTSEPEMAEKEIYSFLRKWWLEHIVGEDKLYGKGISAE